MKKYYLSGQIISLLLLFFIAPTHGQTDGYMFRFGMKDKAGNLWFSNPGNGVYRYNAAADLFTHFTKEDGLNDNHVESISEDKAGNIWFSTQNGVCRYDGRSFTDVSAQAGLCRFDINCVIEDRKGNIWIGTNGWGISRYNTVSRSVTTFTKAQGLGSNSVQCILEDKAGNLWCGERDGWVIRYDSVADRFNKVLGETCFSSQIMNIIEDKKGDILFVNLYNGICRYDGKSFTHINRENGLCNDTVNSIFEDSKGNLWFGSDSKWNTGAGGVCRYDGKSFTNFSLKDGLFNSDVWTIVEDNNKNIWVGTRGGLFKYHTDSGRFVNYTHKLNSSN